MAKTAAERQKYYRDKKRNAQIVMTGVTRVTGESCTELGPVGDALLDRRGGLADYHANRDKYVARREPDKLNWGPWMDMAELEQACLKANRVAIPGDWDYVAPRKVHVFPESGIAFDKDRLKIGAV